MMKAKQYFITDGGNGGFAETFDWNDAEKCCREYSKDGRAWMTRGSGGRT